MHEGKEYPVYKMAISSASHPFFTGAGQFIDTEGRVDKFTKRYALKKKQAEDAAKTPAPEPKKKAKKKAKE
jgi:large subunit ribosomal protein L31